MTREEAVAVLKAFMENPLFSDVHKAAFNIAIHDIKQRHDWDINNLILINKDNYEPLKQEPKTGHWIAHREHCEMNNLRPSGLGSYFWCSNCDCGIDVMEWHRNNYNYCPNCGAEMKEGDL